jgi:dihydroneopterin aldolase/2-amino-4-hydroxy-6-hydroxymethyldihydropteridine diphosphokinase
MHPLDELTITGLAVFAHHGVFDFERREGQTFLIDATLFLPLADAGGTDELARTVHYGELAAEIAAAVERDPVDLIETVAERVAAVVLAHDEVALVRVTVHKPDAPIGLSFTDVAVTITRHNRSLSERSESKGDVVDVDAGVAAEAHRASALSSSALSEERSDESKRDHAPAEHLEAWGPAVATRAIIAMGANLGDREATLRGAVAELEGAGVRVVAASPIVQTPALKLDGVDAGAPAYLNAVVAVDTVLSPRALLRRLNRIEDHHGRTREVRWGDRTLDLDLVSYGTVRVLDQDLVVPHPRAHERAFVLDPWVRLDADAELPGHGRVGELLAEVVAATGERVDVYPAAPLHPDRGSAG